MKKRSIFSLLKLRFKLYLRWVREQYRKNAKPTIEYIPPGPEKIVKEPKSKQNDGCAETGCGCGCLIIFLLILGKIVLWAWHIHWFFGVLMLLFLLGVFGA